MVEIDRRTPIDETGSSSHSIARANSHRLIGTSDHGAVSRRTAAEAMVNFIDHAALKQKRRLWFANPKFS
jgi:hypothetical protein